MLRKMIISFVLASASYICWAQDKDLSIVEQLDKMEMEMDSLSIFRLIDSLIKKTTPIYSEVNFRVGYNSSVSSAGRNYGINQFGLSPGVSYYHKKGFYADVSGFWNSSLDPKYNLTVLSAGYMKFIGKHWTLNGNYERWQYNKTNSDSISYTYDLKNSLNLSTGFTSKHVYGNLDYNYLFGQSSAHRIIGNIAGNLSVYNFWIFDKIRFAPGFSIIYGNSDVTTYFNNDLIENRNFNKIFKDQGFQELTRMVITNADKLELSRIRRSDLDINEKVILRFEIYNKYPEITEFLNAEFGYSYSQSETKKQYGLMNYSFQLPIVFTLNKSFNFILSYSYSIPVKLPGETGTFDPIGYFGASITYRIPFR